MADPPALRPRLALLLLVAVAGCGGGDDDDDDRRAKTPAVEGMFVGEIPKSQALVAVVSSPAVRGKPERDVTVFVCDGSKLCAWLPGAASANRFAAASDDGRTKATGTLTATTASGTIELPGDGKLSYDAKRAGAAAGLYEVKVSAAGTLSGASAAGVGLTGRSTLPKPGDGSLKLADGRRLRFRATAAAGEPGIGVQAGQARLIVLTDGRLSGAGRDRGGRRGFLIRSIRR